MKKVVANRTARLGKGVGGADCGAGPTDVVHGLFGDFVDFLSMACTTFGVCTSLGFGVDVVLNGLRRVDCGTGATCISDVPLDDGSLASKNWKV